MRIVGVDLLGSAGVRRAPEECGGGDESGRRPENCSFCRNKIILDGGNYFSESCFSEAVVTRNAQNTF